MTGTRHREPTWPGKPRPPWTREELRLLASLAGRMPAEDISRELEAVSGVRRSPPAVRAKCRLLGMSLFPVAMTINEFVLAMGVNKRVAERWVADGLLAATWHGRWGRKVDHAEAERFVREHRDRYVWWRMRPGPLRSLAEVAARRVRLLGTPEVAARFGCDSWTLAHWAGLGRIPGARKMPGVNGGRWGIPSTSLPAVRRLLEEALANPKVCLRWKRRWMANVTAAAGRDTMPANSINRTQVSG